MNDDLAFADYSALAAFQDQIHRTVESTTSRTRQAGLQPQSFMLLLALRRLTPEMPTTIVQLVETLGWSRSDVVELVDDLERRGFVARKRDNTDRRRFLISLTPTGEQWLTPLAKDVLRELVSSGPDLLRTVRLVISHAAANVARTQPAPRADIRDFAWQAVGSAPI